MSKGMAGGGVNAVTLYGRLHVPNVEDAAGHGAEIGLGAGLDVHGGTTYAKAVEDIIKDIIDVFINKD